MDEVSDYRRVFLENVSDPNVDWRVSYMNFSDYVELLRASPMETDTDRCNLAHEIKICSELLIKKAIDPKNIATSFALWRQLE